MADCCLWFLLFSPCMQAYRVVHRTFVGAACTSAPKIDKAGGNHHTAHAKQLSATCYDGGHTSFSLPCSCRLLRQRESSVVLLADPPNRTVANRERFMRLVAGDSSEDGERSVGGKGWRSAHERTCCHALAHMHSRAHTHTHTHTQTHTPSSKHAPAPVLTCSIQWATAGVAINSKRAVDYCMSHP